MLCRVALVRTNVSEELSASFIRVTRMGELGTKLAVTNNQIIVTLMKEALSSSETSVLTGAIRRNNPEDASNLTRINCTLKADSANNIILIHISTEYFSTRSHLNIQKKQKIE
jgi:hypothetical protein